MYNPRVRSEFSTRYEQIAQINRTRQERGVIADRVTRDAEPGLYQHCSGRYTVEVVETCNDGHHQTRYVVYKRGNATCRMLLVRFFEMVTLAASGRTLKRFSKVQ